MTVLVILHAVESYCVRFVFEDAHVASFFQGAASPSITVSSLSAMDETSGWGVGPQPAKLNGQIGEDPMPSRASA